MRPKETLTRILKLFFGDTRQAIISYIVLALIAMGGGLLALSKTALNLSIQIMTTPTPLWATISLVLLGCLYIHLKFRSLSISLTKPVPTNLNLKKEEILILQCLADQLDYAQLAIIMHKCQLSYQVAQYYLQELEDKSLIDRDTVDYQQMWSINHNGREYLLHHKLLH